MLGLLPDLQDAAAINQALCHPDAARTSARCPGRAPTAVDRSRPGGGRGAKPGRVRKA